MTYDGGEISVDALHQRIDTVERNMDEEIYRSEAYNPSRLIRLVIAENHEDNTVKYLATGKTDAPTEDVARLYAMHWRIETSFEDSVQDFGFGDQLNPDLSALWTVRSKAL